MREYTLRKFILGGIRLNVSRLMILARIPNTHGALVAARTNLIWYRLRAPLRDLQLYDGVCRAGEPLTPTPHDTHQRVLSLILLEELEYEYNLARSSVQ